MDIKKIEIYSETNEPVNMKYSRVYYEDGSEEKIEDWDKTMEKISQFIGDKNRDTILNDKSKFEVIKLIDLGASEDKPEIAREEETVEEVREDASEAKGNEHKIGKAVIKITSIATALLLGGIVLKGCSNKRSGTPESNDKTIEYNVDDQNVVTRINHEEPVPYNDNNFIQNVENAYNSDVNGIVSRYIAMDYMTPLDFYNNLNEKVNPILSTNMYEVCNVVDGGRMTGDKYVLDFSKLFDYGTNDYIALSTFCQLRNVTVQNAYLNVSEITKSDVRNYLDEFVSFALNNGALYNNNGEAFTFYELNPMTRYIISYMGLKMLEPNIDYKGYINDKEYSQRELQEIAYEQFNNIVNVNLNSLVNKSK